MPQLNMKRSNFFYLILFDFFILYVILFNFELLNNKSKTGILKWKSYFVMEWKKSNLLEE